MEWFIAMLFPYLRIPMGHKNIDTHEKALEVAMKLEAAPRDETQLGVQQIQGQLEEMQVEIQILCKEHETGSSPLKSPDTRKLREPLVWFSDCQVEGLHDTHHCPHLAAYVPKIK